jgi:twitching motility two-component system response regulator PilG
MPSTLGAVFSALAVNVVDGGLNMATNDNDFEGLKVMVIDDSKTIRRTAENLLSKVGCQVSTVQDGFEALSAVMEFRPDIIFMDVMMPRLDGYQACALIKHNESFRQTPIVMLSSKDGLFDKAKGRVVGSEDYLTKPFTKDELLQTLRNHTTVQSEI